LNASNWLGLGNGAALNTKTGQLIQAFDPVNLSGGGSGGNLNSADYKTFIDFASSVFLPLAESNKRAEVVRTQGEDVAALTDFTSAFKNADGSLNLQEVTKNLTEGQLATFAEYLTEYTQNYQIGVDPTKTFQAQVTNTGLMRDPKTKELFIYKRLPNGKVEIKSNAGRRVPLPVQK